MLEAIEWLVDFVLHFDDHLQQVLTDYGGWTYAFLFLIVFCETGLVVTPFLPGDSLLFAAGTFAATGPDGSAAPLSLPVLLASLTVAAILGDTVNYAIGRRLGEAVLAREKLFLIKREHIRRTEEFFAKPNHPYAQALLAEVPRLGVTKRSFKPIEGEIPSPLDPPSGCHFHPRCPFAHPRCQAEAPVLKQIAPRRHAVARSAEG